MVVIRFGGGGIVLDQLVKHNSDFAVVGLPAAMSARLNKMPVVALAAISDQPLFVLLGRADLRNSVRSIADLRGKVIGVTASSSTTKTTTEQLTELLLRNAGVPPDAVRFSNVGKTWLEQSAVMSSGTVDAIMSDEPFASRLVEEGKAFVLTNLAEPATTQNIPGAGFLMASLISREDLIQKDPHKIALMVKILKRTLAWIATHSPEEIADAVGVDDPEERRSLILVLTRYQHVYSRDSAFSTRQLIETERFFRTSNPNMPGIADIRLEKMVTDHWAGRKE